MKKLKSLSFFVPFWNEEENIDKVVNNILSSIDAVAQKWELILVDDGSTDKTLKKAEGFAKKDKRIRVISYKKNRGYGGAVKTGLENAKLDIVSFIDGDGQFDFSEIKGFIEKIDSHDMVIGFRKKRFDHPLRHLLMNLLKVWDYALFGFYFKDIDCGFKMFKKEAVKKILPLSAEGAMVTTEILAKGKKNHFKITQVDVSHFKRLYGYQSGGSLRVIFRAIKESFVIRKELYGRT